MLQIAITFLCLSLTVFACEKFPNNTARQLDWYNCARSDIGILKVRVTDGEGKSNYPIKLKTEVVLTFDAINSGPSYEKVFANLVLYTWSNEGIFRCKWVEIPLDYLIVLDICKMGTSCPIPSGESKITIKIPSAHYGTIKCLLSEGQLYKFRFHLKDSTNQEEIGCVDLNGQISKK